MLKLAPARSPLTWLASPRWTVAVFVLTGAGALAVAYGWADATVAMSVPFAILAMNLVAAILTKARFRADVPLLLFHVALLALVTLAVVGRLTYFDGMTTVTVGEDYDAQAVWGERGPLHRDRLADLRFANDGFVEQYAPGGAYAGTLNRVRWSSGDDDEAHTAEIGNDRPLLHSGYRIYPARRRGYAPVFAWQPRDGEVDYGTVQLHDARDGQFAPANEWQLPGGPEVWVMLDVPETPASGPRRHNLDAAALEHRLVLRIRSERHELQPGDAIELPEGVLAYVRLDSWMGYRITYDPTQPWMIATAVVGMLSLSWFYWGRVAMPRRRRRQ